jgi:hypothetical protein
MSHVHVQVQRYIYWRNNIIMKKLLLLLSLIVLCITKCTCPFNDNTIFTEYQIIDARTLTHRQLYNKLIKDRIIVMSYYDWLKAFREITKCESGHKTSGLGLWQWPKSIKQKIGMDNNKQFSYNEQLFYCYSYLVVAGAKNIRTSVDLYKWVAAPALAHRDITANDSIYKIYSHLDLDQDNDIDSLDWQRRIKRLN